MTQESDFEANRRLGKEHRLLIFREQFNDIAERINVGQKALASVLNAMRVNDADAENIHYLKGWAEYPEFLDAICKEFDIGV